MKKKPVVFLFLFLLVRRSLGVGGFLLLFLASSAQQDSCSIRISLLTCAPGEELYSTFGHTAIRVSGASGADLVFNYGSFEFGPDFYTQFIRGKLLYFLSVENWEDFRYQYFMENRSVKEQVVQLSCAEKQKLYSALVSNASEEHRFYRYDFLFDNCTTRAGKMIISQTDTPVLFRNILPENKPSFRDLIHSYLDAAHQNWSKLGIDILLGVKLDRTVTNEEAMFLPDYLLKGFDSARVGTRPLVTPPTVILDRPAPPPDKPFLTPFVIFSVVTIAILALSLARSRWAVKTLLAFDFLFFFFLGLAGLLLLFMWFGTDHIVCRNNYNLLWALPTNVVMAFFVHSKKAWAQKYFGLVSFISLLLLVTWAFLPQDLNNSLIPLVVLTALRSWQSSKNPTNERSNRKA